MISRQEAIAIYQHYNQGFSARVESMIRSAVSGGVNISTSPLLISYSTITNAVATAVAAELTASGWNVANDSTAKILTVS